MTGTTLFAGIIFGTIGFAAFVYGKKQSDLKVLVIGVALMAFPYFIPNPIALYAIGVALIAALFIFHD